MADRRTLLAGVLAVVTAGCIFYISVDIFPYHSTNHDEAVYLQQAGMILDRTLVLRPPIEASFRPWFFVQSNAVSSSKSVLYPKYPPIAAAMFAFGKLLGSYRFALSLIAGSNVWLTYSVVTEVFDRRTGIIAALLLVLSPLFLIQSALFLSYAPTTALNLAFAFAYFRANRTGELHTAALAGLFIGIAFFSRPYTAVLFAVPFIVHAIWTLYGDNRSARMRQATTAVVGLCGVMMAVGYNALMTGSPLLFPYQAFAPHDGLGFGHRAILGYERIYTPALALEANIRVVGALFSDWIVAGPLGTAFAAGGLFAITIRRQWDGKKAVLAGLFCSIIVGNICFWGNLNILGVLASSDDGLIKYYGPQYHFDLLVPTAAFAAHGAVVGKERLNHLVSRQFDTGRTGSIVAVVLVVSTVTFGGAAAVTVAEPLQENAAISTQLEEGYKPFENRSFDNALVFLPTPYGDWLNHPFQALRNDPEYDGDVLYAIQENQFAVVDAYPNRTFYRYGYRGQWGPFFGSPVDANLQRVQVVRGERIVLENHLTVPATANDISIRLATNQGYAYYAADDPGKSLDFQLVTTERNVHLVGEVESLGNRFVPIGPQDSVQITAFVDQGTGSGFNYRVRMPVERSNGTVGVLTPYVEVCQDPRRCGGEAMYISGETVPNVSVETRLVKNQTETNQRGDGKPLGQDDLVVHQ
jgi:Dolichyl-phosphate-mannose-protein mannosyltransferase